MKKAILSLAVLLLVFTNTNAKDSSNRDLWKNYTVSSIGKSNYYLHAKIDQKH